MGIALFGARASAQTRDRDQVTPLRILEAELKTLGAQILNHPNLEHKRKLNAEFMNRMETILKRSDSYNYPFDSLVTVSRIFPQDQSFRLFTWQIDDRDTLRTRHNHYYFGFIQRRFHNKKKKLQPVVVRLNDVVDKSNEVEQTPLTADKWLGAIYYKPRNTEFGVLTYQGSYQKVEGINGKPKTFKTPYYVVLGWNGHNIGSDYKIVDVISFDPLDTLKVNFGAPLFYFGAIPKARCVFKYSDNSPFALNLGTILLGGKKKTLAITFDHLNKPTNDREKRLWSAGTDGATDALVFTKKSFQDRKGFFYYAPNVTVYEEAIEKFDPKVIQKQIREEKKRLAKMGVRSPNLKQKLK